MKRERLCGLCLRGFITSLVLYSLLFSGCSDEPVPPEMVTQDYLTAVSEGDMNAIYYVRQYAQKDVLTLADQEHIQSTILPARFATLRKGGLREVQIDNVEEVGINAVRVHYTLLFYKPDEQETGVLTLEQSHDDNGYRWFVVN